MSAPFFSVVIPAYNAGQFLEATLASLSRQTCREFETIIVDDGSTDDTPQKLRAFIEAASLDLKCLRQTNRGIGAARNAGIRAAVGLFVAFLDADDLWYPNKLAHIREFLLTHPEVELVCHDEFQLIQNRRGNRNTLGSHSSFRDLLLEGNCISTSATAVRRSKLLSAGLFSEDMRFNGVEDYELWLRLAKISRIAHLPEALGEYRVHPSGISRKIDEHIEHQANVLKAHLPDLAPLSFSDRIRIRRRWARLWRSGGLGKLRVRQYSEAAAYLMRSLRQDPLSVKSALLLAFCVLQRARQFVTTGKKPSRQVLPQTIGNNGSNLSTVFSPRIEEPRS